jgi:hypothetical protein
VPTYSKHEESARDPGDNWLIKPQEPPKLSGTRRVRLCLPFHISLRSKEESSPSIPLAQIRIMSHIDRLARPLLEVACFNGDSGVHAAEGGADRIEYAARTSSPCLAYPPFNSMLDLKLRNAI